MKQVIIFAASSLLFTAACAPLADKSHPVAATKENGTASANTQRNGIMPTELAIQKFEQRVASQPDDFITRTLLAQLQIRAARESGDLNYFLEAEKSLQQALSIQPDYPQARSLFASVKGSLHNFEEALEIAKETYAKDPSRIEALGTIYDAQVELGRYEDAKKTLARLKAAGEDPTILAREAHMAELTGDNDEAMRLLKQASKQIEESGAAPEELAWFQFRLGDIHNHTGDKQGAARHFETALKILPGYPVALSNLAELRAEEGKLDEAISLMQLATEGREAPGSYFLLGDLLTESGKVKEAKEAYARGEEIANRGDMYEVLYSRELARHYVDNEKNIDKAISLLERDFARRPDIFGSAELGWAYYKAGRFNDAAKALEQAMRAGIKEPEFFYHAALIQRELGNSKKAEKLLRQAVSYDPGFEEAKAALGQISGKSLHNAGHQEALPQGRVKG